MKLTAIMCLVFGVVVASHAMYVSEDSVEDSSAELAELADGDLEEGGYLIPIPWMLIVRPILKQVKKIGVNAARKLMERKNVPKWIIDLVLKPFGKRDLSVEDVDTELVEADIGDLEEGAYLIPIPWMLIVRPILKQVKKIGVNAARKLMERKNVPKWIIDLVLKPFGKRDLSAEPKVDYDTIVQYGLIDSIRDTIRGILNHLKAKFNDLKNFFIQTLKDTHGQLKPHLDNIKDLAKDFIDHANAATDGVKDQALKFFNQYKNDLGLLWKQVQDAAKHVHGQITGKRDLAADDEVDYEAIVEFGLIDSIRDTIRGIINHLKGKFNDLKNFFLQTLKDTHGQLKPHLDNIKDLAKDFIDHATAATDGVKDQALKFFNQYKNDLGLLWKQVQDAAKHVHGQITGF